MKRLALLILLLVTILACSSKHATAQSSMEVVPPLHWSYAALNLLSMIDELSGYPAGYFDVDSDYRAEHGVALRRYEMEQVVARAQVSMWNRLNWQQNYVPYLVSDLCHEFNALPDHNPDPQLDDCQCTYVIQHGLIVPREHWSYGALLELAEIGLIEERPDMPIRYPMGQRDVGYYINYAADELQNRDADAPDTKSLRITLECFQSEFFDLFGPFRAGYHTLADWVCPALDYLAATGYIDGYPHDFFNTDALHFQEAATQPTMLDCYEATQVFRATLGEMQARGENYPSHLDYLADDLAEICKNPPIPEEEGEPARSDARSIKNAQSG